MSKIKIHTKYVTSDVAYRSVEARSGIDEVDDMTAATIASWWQSPGSPGSELAALASGAEVDYSALLEDVHRTRTVHGAGNGLGITRSDRHALDALCTWAMQRTSNGRRDYRPEVSPVMRYASVVFQQGDDAAEVLDLIERQGDHAGLEHLALGTEVGGTDLDQGRITP